MKTILISCIYALLICVTIFMATAAKHSPLRNQRTADFSFANSYPLNRLLTPNGDRKNDVFIFKCYTAKDSAVTGKIFSIAGRKVAEMTLIKVEDFDYYLKWDPNSGGNRVPGGIYIYQIEVESRAYTGTVVVIR